MTLTDQLTEYVNAAFTGIWVQTLEPDEAEREILRHARQEKWKVAVWDIATGLRVATSSTAGQPEIGAGDPLAALRALPGLAERNGTALLLLHNLHRFLNNPEVIQTTICQLVAGKQQRTFIVVLSPVVQIPVELEKLFVVLDHALPDRAALDRIARELTSDSPNDVPADDLFPRVLDAAAGLTRYEAEGAFALSLTRHNAIRPDVIWELKAQTLRKNNLLTLHRGGETFETLGGLANLKDFCRRTLQPGKRVRPRGVLLLGVPGTGKSAFCKALGNETGRPTLTLDLGSLMGSLVGATEQNVRQALRIAPRDAEFLLRSLPRLPGKSEFNKPLTLDLNGHVSVRARAAGQPRTTELVLASSEATGAATRLNLNRDHLNRALQLGFTEIRVVSAGKPMVCRDDNRTYLLMPLEPKDALPPSADALRIDSPTDTRPLRVFEQPWEKASVSAPSTHNLAPVPAPIRRRATARAITVNRGELWPF